MTCKTFITSNKIKIDFKLLTVKSYGLKWKPRQAIPQQCKDAIQKYEKDLSIHEGKHIQDLIDIVKLANEKWKDKPYYGCGNNKQEAMADIEKQIEENGEKIVKDMIKDYDNNYVPKVEQEYKIKLDCRPCGNV